MNKGSTGSSKFLTYLTEKLFDFPLFKSLFKTEATIQYSTDEIDTGKKWIDGRTIYAIAYEVPSDTFGTNIKLTDWPPNLEPINANGYIDSGGANGIAFNIISISTGSNFQVIWYWQGSGELQSTTAGGWTLQAGTKIYMEYVR